MRLMLRLSALWLGVEPPFLPIAPEAMAATEGVSAPAGWALPGSRRVGARLEERPNPVELIVDYAYVTRTGVRVQMVRAPVPVNGICLAQRAPDQLMALMSKHGNAGAPSRRLAP